MNPHSTIHIPQSTIHNSTIHNHQSSIINPQSTIINFPTPFPELLVFLRDTQGSPVRNGGPASFEKLKHRNVEKMEARRAPRQNTKKGP